MSEIPSSEPDRPESEQSTPPERDEDARWNGRLIRQMTDAEIEAARSQALAGSIEQADSEPALTARQTHRRRLEPTPLSGLIDLEQTWRDTGWPAGTEHVTTGLEVDDIGLAPASGQRNQKRGNAMLGDFMDRYGPAGRRNG